MLFMFVMGWISLVMVVLFFGDVDGEVCEVVLVVFVWNCERFVVDG